MSFKNNVERREKLKYDPQTEDSRPQFHIKYTTEQNIFQVRLKI
jgi:hypothetical protein